MGEHHVYRDSSYDLGSHLLILRTRIALTQIALAEQLGHRLVPLVAELAK